MLKGTEAILGLRAFSLLGPGALLDVILKEPRADTASTPEPGGD